MKVEVIAYKGNDDEDLLDDIRITEIGERGLDQVYIAPGESTYSNGKVWIDTYSKENRPNGRTSTSGWVDLEAAEAIANAILLAVQITRQRS